MRGSIQLARPVFGIAVLLLVIVGAVGCGGGKTCPVQGKVVYPDGTPVVAGMVMFESMNPETKVGAEGGIEADGSFRLSTFTKGDGAVEGRHRVAVVPLRPNPRRGGQDEDAPRPRPTQAPVFDPRFMDFKTSGLELMVTRGKNDFTITVEKPSGARAQRR